MGDGMNAVKGTSRESGALSASEVEHMLSRATQNILGIPEFQSEELQQLFHTFAPIWQVETDGPDDRLGAPVWVDNEHPADIDTRQPIMYQHLSYIRFDGRILPQLNYTVWFPARPGKTSMDLLAGHIDGMTWRVTIDTDGRPLIYDSMHNCGCYHLFFPTEKLIAKPEEGALQEAAFSPQQMPALQAGQVIVLRIASVTHYLIRVILAGRSYKSDADETVSLSVESYNTLRSLPFGDDLRHSLFQNNGIIAGTQRSERFLIWPMGVPYPGEMRQWGHHATAFLGRRHFDDPEIIKQFFERKF